MIYRTLGSTGISVSSVGVGTWQFGGEWGETYTQPQADAIFDAARDCGINLIDTAECYGDHLSEEFVGVAVERDRDQWILATKFGHKFHEPFERDNRFKPDEVRTLLEDSLRALRTDRIDLYQFHSLDDDAFDTDGLWELLLEEKQKGKIRHLGVSIGSNQNIYQTRKAVDVGAEAIQVVYNRLDRNPEGEVLPACKELNLGVLARVPLASGYLSGKYKPGASFSDNDVRGKWHQPEQREKALREVAEIQSQEVPKGMDMAGWALAWCLKNEAVTSVIPGCKNPDQVRANAAATDLVKQS